MKLTEGYKNRLTELAGIKSKKPNKNLKQALEKVLSIAQEKLERAKAKNNQWDIEHYENDIKIIKQQQLEAGFLN